MLPSTWQACLDLGTADLGRVAEHLAVRLLVKHRVSVLSRNVTVGRGEVDILALIGGIRSVVEVRSVRQGQEPVDPISAFNESKARQVRYLAGRLGAGRVDLVTVSFSPAGVDLHWLPWAE
jgi:Holliday junction resolvase-like predicted endonuclease